MSKTTTDNYEGWDIRVTAENNMCAHYSFAITDPSGRTQHVKMGGESEQRALERAREMIDMEISFQNDE